MQVLSVFSVGSISVMLATVSGCQLMCATCYTMCWQQFSSIRFKLSNAYTKSDQRQETITVQRTHVKV